jgi:heme exporter protein A
MRITAENLSCQRGGRGVFSNLNFTVSSGEFLQLTGPNGAGKSSLLRLFANLSDPSTGHLRVENGEADLTLAQQAHYTENLNFWRDFLGDGDINQALAAVNLQALADYPVALLSAGQKRRAGLARLALVARKIWLLDEPSVGLDDTSQLLLVNLMKQNLQSGGIIIAATHVDLGLKPDKNLALGARP